MPVMIEGWLLYLLLGAVAGLLAGMLGIGGGLIIVPVLAFWFALQDFPATMLMQLAVGSSLATIVFTSLSSVRSHHLRRSVNWGLLRMLAPGIVLGAATGALLARGVQSEVLRLIFGLFECLVGLQFIFRMQAQDHRLPLSPGQGWVAGGVIGLVSALLGIGGGTLTVPYLRWHGIDMRQAVGTAAAAGLPIALAGATGYLLVGLWLPDLPAGASGFLYWPAIAGISVSSVLLAPLGAKMAHVLPRALLQRLFGGLLLLLGVRMLWG